MTPGVWGQDRCVHPHRYRGVISPRVSRAPSAPFAAPFSMWRSVRPRVPEGQLVPRLAAEPLARGCRTFLSLLGTVTCEPRSRQEAARDGATWLVGACLVPSVVGTFTHRLRCSSPSGLGSTDSGKFHLYLVTCRERGKGEEEEEEMRTRRKRGK